jgi:hypothetical protein
MINILGIKRVIILAVLIVLNAGLAAGIYAYMNPALEKKNRELRSSRSQANNVQNDIDRMQVEIEEFADQQVLFEKYKADGFFIEQNRRQVQDLFKLIQEKSGVSVATVAVNPAIVEENEEAEKAEHVILKSTVQVALEALDDQDVYRYLYLIDKFYPGHVTVERVEFERDAEINGTVLRAIAGGKNFPLVKADLELVWRTMVPKALVGDGEVR